MTEIEKIEVIIIIAAIAICFLIARQWNHNDRIIRLEAIIKVMHEEEIAMRKQIADMREGGVNNACKEML